MKNKPRRRLSPDKRREEILETTENIIEKNGYDSITVAEIVEKAGTARGNFYRYFRSTEEAVKAVIKKILPDILNAILSLDFKHVKTGNDLENELYKFYFYLGKLIKKRGVFFREIVISATNKKGIVGKFVKKQMELIKEHAKKIGITYSGKTPFRKFDPYLTSEILLSMVFGGILHASDNIKEFDYVKWAKEMASFETGALLDYKSFIDWRKDEKI